MRSIRNLFAWSTVAVVAWLGFAPATLAEDLRTAAFFGQWVGSGIAHSQDSLYFGVTVRDLDVRIGPTSDGFSISWTTVLRQGGDPDNPDVRRRSTAIDFVSSARPRVFHAREAQEPLEGGSYIWARIKERTLTVYIFNIDDDGVYDMQSYARTLSGTGMDLNFTRIRDGEPMRSVNAKLVKAAN